MCPFPTLQDNLAYSLWTDCQTFPPGRPGLPFFWVEEFIPSLILEELIRLFQPLRPFPFLSMRTERLPFPVQQKKLLHARPQGAWLLRLHARSSAISLPKLGPMQTRFHRKRKLKPYSLTVFQPTIFSPFSDTKIFFQCLLAPHFSPRSKTDLSTATKHHGQFAPPLRLTKLV